MSTFAELLDHRSIRQIPQVLGRACIAANGACFLVYCLCTVKWRIKSIPMVLPQTHPNHHPRRRCKRQ